MTGMILFLILLFPQASLEDSAKSCGGSNGAIKEIQNLEPGLNPGSNQSGSKGMRTEWSSPVFCSTYPNWDYWWLNTRIGIDDKDRIHVLTSLYNYSQSSPNFHRDVLDIHGNIIQQDPDWNGYHDQPIVTDDLGHNHYIGHPVLGWDVNMDSGAVDGSNCIYSSHSNGSGDIYYTKLDALGSFIHNYLPVATGNIANSWAGDSHLDINSQEDIYVCWSRDMHEIVYSMSTDDGLTWCTPIVIASDLANQVNKPEMFIGPDDHIYFIWQHWTGSANRLTYKKLYPDGTCCVDSTELTTSLSAWAPEFAMDGKSRIHIVWSPSHNGSQSLYYTVIDGLLDKGGAPATDNEISIVQEYPFYTSSDAKRYPKIAIDSLDNPHVIFDQGEYGSGKTKTVYHIRQLGEYLNTDLLMLSASAGGTVNFTLTAGTDKANRSYLLAGSLSGTDPGTLLPGGLATIPLNRDWFTDLIINHLSYPHFVDFWGTLDNSGNGAASLNIAALNPSWAGTIMHFAYATAFPWDFASNPVLVEIVP